MVRSALRKRAALVLACTASVLGCRADPITLPAGDEAFLYIILGQRTPNLVAGVSGQHGYLLRSGRPDRPATFLEADRFEMRREVDGALFGWQSYGFSGETADVLAVSYSDANYHLPDGTTAGGLGADSIGPGERYELDVAIDGSVIRGSVTVPETFSATVREQNDRAVATWPRVSGAAGYQLHIPDEDLVLLTDTFYPLPEALIGTGAELVVDALDPNIWLYLTDDQAASAGIEGAFGLFGAMTSARLRL